MDHHARVGRADSVEQRPNDANVVDRFNNCLATKIGVAVPKTVLLPSKEHPPDTADKSFRNLAYPLDWEAIFEYIGFPAFFKPFAGGGWKNVYRVDQPGGVLPRLRRDRPARDDAPGGDRLQRVLPLLQPSTARTSTSCSTTRGSRSTPATCANGPPVDPALLQKVHDDVLALNVWLGYDFNTVEMAVRDGVPYAIDFCNPAPDADVNSIGQDNFSWIVDKAADMVIRRAKAHVEGGDNLRWGQYVQKAAAPPVSAVGTAPVTAAATAVGTIVATAVSAVNAVTGALSPKE